MKIPESKLKFIAYIFVPFIIVYGFYFSLLDFYVYPKYNLFSARALIKKSYLENTKPSEVDYLVIGDSSGMYSINPLILSENSFNMANVAQTAYFTYKNLLANPNLKINKGIIITQTFIPDHYNEDVWSVLIPVGEMNLTDVFNMYCLNSDISCSFGKKIELVTKYFSHKFYLSAHSLRDMAKFIAHFSKDNHQDKLNYFKSFIAQNRGHYSSPVYAKSNIDEIETSWKRNFSSSIAEYPASEKFYLNLISKWAREKKVPLFFFVSPLATCVYPQFDTDEYSKSIQEILKQVDIPPHRIINSKNFKKLFIEEDFVDINHINEDGARKNTLALKNVLVTSD
jgi:hypothetical protein